MDRKGIVVLSLLWLLSGCAYRPNDNQDMYQRAIRYAQSLVDSGYITNDYIQLYELHTNASGSIYSIFGTNDPNADYSEYPSQIIKVGGKYFCFTELDEPELSVEQIYRITNVYDTGLVMRESDIWFLGISRNKDAGTMVKRSSYADDLFDYPELWPYFSGGQPEERGFCVVMYTHNMVLSDADCLDADSLNFQIKRICGSIEVKNKTDSTIVLRPDSFGRTFITVNGGDTLMFSLQKSLPLEIPANQYGILSYETQANIDFFHRLPDKNTLMFMSNLLKDSTYCLLEINGKSKKSRLLYNDYFFYRLVDDSGEILRDVWHEGIFDKDKRGERFLNILNGI